MHVVVIYFTLYLLICINGYRNVYFRNNVCLEFLEMVFKENMHCLHNY